MLNKVYSSFIVSDDLPTFDEFCGLSLFVFFSQLESRAVDACCLVGISLR